MKCGPAWLPSCAFALVIGITGAIGGCALTERAEALYMRQQGVQSALASAVSEVETAQPGLAARLYGLEDELHTACSPLREAGQRRFEGQDLGSDLEWAIVTSLQQCESTTSTVERLVQQAEAGNLADGPVLDTFPAALDYR